jgi:hypothetical protein
MAAKKKALDHVAWKPPGTLLCLHCGVRYDMALPAPITMVSAMSLSFEKAHKGCKATRGIACHFCGGFGHEATSCDRLQYRGDPYLWRNGPDTGLSSETIWSVMMGRPPMRPSEPLDPSDFGRCYRLLQAFPAWRDRMGEMAAIRGWERLAPAWAELEALYVEELPSGKCPRLYARMRELELQRRSTDSISEGHKP